MYEKFALITSIGTASSFGYFSIFSVSIEAMQTNSLQMLFFFYSFPAKILEEGREVGSTGEFIVVRNII